MRLLISDANILIDMEAGALMETLFRLPMQFGIPDLLYYEEIEPASPGLEDLGLQVMEVSGDFVAYAQQLPGQHNHLLPAKNGPKPSHNDYLALALAKQETCTLLTGDTNLRIVANKEQVNVMGTIGFGCRVVQRFALKLEDRVDRVADTLGQLQVAWTATLTAPALQSLGANAPALRELVFVEHAAITG